MFLGVEQFFFFFQAEEGIRYADVTGVQTCALPICSAGDDGNLTFQTEERFFAHRILLSSFVSSAATLAAPGDHSTTSNFFNASSLIVRPSPGRFSSSSMVPSLGSGSPLKIYQNSSLPTSTSTIGKNSAMGEFRLAMTM